MQQFSYREPVKKAPYALENHTPALQQNPRTTRRMFLATALGALSSGAVAGYLVGRAEAAPMLERGVAPADARVEWARQLAESGTAEQLTKEGPLFLSVAERHSEDPVLARGIVRLTKECLYGRAHDQEVLARHLLRICRSPDAPKEMRGLRPHLAAHVERFVTLGGR